jgi:hypothetical protein
MPGSSVISGLMACNNSRHVNPTKPRTITFDAELLLGVDAENDLVTLTAVLHYFVPAGEIDPADDCIYLVTGKISSVEVDSPLGEGRAVEEFDLQIDAITVRTLLYVVLIHLMFFSSFTVCPEMLGLLLLLSLLRVWCVFFPSFIVSLPLLLYI